MVLAVGLPRGESGGCAAEPLRRARGKIMDACFAMALELPRSPCLRSCPLAWLLGGHRFASAFTFVRTRLPLSHALSPLFA